MRGVPHAAACKPAATSKCGAAPYETTRVATETAWVSGEATCATSKSARMAAAESATRVAAAAVETTTAAAAVKSAATTATVSTTAAAMLSERG